MRPERGAVQAQKLPAAVYDGQADRETPPSPNALAYSLLSGAIATVAGALASLTVAGTVKLAVWCAVTGATAAASGLAHDSAATSACWWGVQRWVRCSRRPS